MAERPALFETSERYQITTFDGHSQQFSRTANQSIVAGLKWEDVAGRIDRSQDGNQLNADFTTVHGQPYYFKDEHGKLNKLERYVL